MSTPDDPAERLPKLKNRLEHYQVCFQAQATRIVDLEADLKELKAENVNLESTVAHLQRSLEEERKKQENTQVISKETRSPHKVVVKRASEYPIGSSQNPLVVDCDDDTNLNAARAESLSPMVQHTLKRSADLVPPTCPSPFSSGDSQNTQQPAPKKAKATVDAARSSLAAVSRETRAPSSRTVKPTTIPVETDISYGRGLTQTRSRLTMSIELSPTVNVTRKSASHWDAGTGSALHRSIQTQTQVAHSSVAYNKLAPRQDPAKGKALSHPPMSVLVDEETDSESSQAENNVDELEETQEIKIPKPYGKDRRPYSGGYSVQMVLNWPAPRYKELSDTTTRLIEEYLDPIFPYSQQSRKKLQLVREKIVHSFPELGQYDNLWPIADIIRRRLDYMSRKLRNL